MSTGADDSIAAWRALLLAQNAVLRAIDEDLLAAGRVSLQRYDVLLELNAAPDKRLRMKDLASRTVLTRSRVSKLIDEMAAEGLVQRESDPSDRRGATVRLTAHGRDALRKGAPVYLSGIERHFTTHLTKAEQRTITHALQKVVDGHQPLIDARVSR